MKAGKLDQRLEILRPSGQRSAGGARRGEYEVVCTVSAQKVSDRGRRVVEAAEYFPDHVCVFYVRDLAPVEENWRVRHIGGHLYTVTSIETLRRRGLKILNCSRVNK